MTTPTSYWLRPGRVAFALSVVAGVLLLVHVASMQLIFNDNLGVRDSTGLEYWHLSIFDLDEEESFGTWFSSLVLLSAGALLLVQARALRDRADRWFAWWLVLAIGFVTLSVDEVVGMHELMNSLMEDTPWTVVGFAIFAVVGVSYLPFLWRYRWRTAGLFFLAGAVYGGGAVGVEHWTGADVNSLHYNMWTTLEEGMEMAGVIIFVYALLDHMSRGQDTEVRLAVSGEDPG
jgi:hypothetical protein